ncbi:PWWP domain-containing DNA repair factor 3A isoform X1 [Chiroxiphia lanceolata]|uniref:PWWP domain-containing DNA repair factor 3A isoform X1 n=1 Tax=Chiroxiphia lanceolata TaxID=296741 RepID=UPI0013CEF649|nr:PWWP domain-containing DNA repair factor 3A isoform X1 [Chiroxiphia lanceolata]XP_032568278.1 PWWP domain-containing DNA repair factor 3A isoform X1 [Chiroxiphia lanceolata]XP_032568279.1 PWWP domain-containing DNA repair factor 3A isoform X1 [Chiroxiphia lanceolata]XP_032568280.1 PWWP domain-containing DNA repair factor 3A isoform X1 [Chiroxiphia lanceolata]XP_032568281.1 PWWP domain-containing DNA repair factor 3A isoform X1 [Chiroxiphia lanceolata]
MADPEFVLCKWKRRLWPAKVLCKPGVAGSAPVGTTAKMGFKAEILGLEKQVSVSSANAIPLTEERIKAIASSLEQKNNVSEAVEELQYRCSLKIALDILTQTDSGRQAPPAEGPNPELSRDRSVESPPATPSRSSLWCSRSTKLQPEAAKGKRDLERNCNLRNATRTRILGGSLPSGESGQARGAGTSPAKARGAGINPSRCGPRDLSDAPAPASHNCKVPRPKSSPRQRKIQPKPGSKVSLKTKEGKGQQGRKRSCRDDSPQGQAQLPPEEGSLPVPSKSDTVEPAQRTGTQPGRTFLDSSGERASDELEKSISSESESLAKQLDGRRKAEGGKQLDGAGVASGRERKCRNHSGSSPGPSGAFPQPQEQENKDPSPLAGNKAKQMQLPDSEEDEGLDPSEMSSRAVSSESFPPLSPLADEEEEDFPCVLSCQVPQSIEEGMLVWCKFRRYPYWPAVVKTVKRKPRRACVLFIDGTTNEKKKGFSVSLKTLKHFDCEEKQELIERAKENYPQEIEWCLQLIRDYWVRVGCHSFTGSFLEYLAADISYPVRKQGHQGEVEMTFPNTAEEDLGESSLENSPQKPLRRLLPDRSRAARDRENKKLVEFIVKTKGAEEHLRGILKSGKKSRWLKKFLNSYWYVTRVETYLEDEEQLELVFDYLKEVYREMDTTNLRQILGDGIKFISDVLLPEAIIYAIAAVYDIDYKKAEEKYIKGPPVTKRERELFDEQIRAWKKLKSTLEPEES